MLPNGFDPRVFVRRDVDRASLFRDALVEAPRGWSRGPGSRQRPLPPEDVSTLVDGVVVLTVSRFTAVKRLPLLIEAFAQARDRARTPTGLVIVGGHPGEWEEEHPADTIARLGVRGVFLAGWRDHVEVSAFLSAADVFALASVREQFGLVLVEAMACEMAVVAVDRFGPARSSTTAKPAGSWSPTMSGASPPRCSTQSTTPPSGRAAAPMRALSPSSATAGQSSPSALPACWMPSVIGTPRHSRNALVQLVGMAGEEGFEPSIS